MKREVFKKSISLLTRRQLHFDKLNQRHFGPSIDNLESAMFLFVDADWLRRDLDWQLQVPEWVFCFSQGSWCLYCSEYRQTPPCHYADRYGRVDSLLSVSNSLELKLL